VEGDEVIMGSEPDNRLTHVEHYARIYSENVAFCKSNPDALKAAIQLTNLTDDAQTYTAWEETTSPEQFGKRVRSSAMENYICFIFRPLVFAAHFDFLAGNIFTVFMQLRTLLEQLAKCYHADMLPEAAKETFFATRVQIVEEKYQYISDIIETLGPGSKELWRKLSNDWVHMKRMNKLVNTVIQDGVPSFTNIVPIEYIQEDMSTIREITEDSEQFRGLMKSALEKWQAGYGKKTGT
jgi:hypothetical protein